MVCDNNSISTTGCNSGKKYKSNIGVFIFWNTRDMLINVLNDLQVGITTRDHQSNNWHVYLCCLYNISFGHGWQYIMQWYYWMHYELVAFCVDIIIFHKWANYLDLCLEFDEDGKLYTRPCDKRDAIDFPNNKCYIIK